MTIYNPNDDSVVSDKVQVASEADVDKAVAAAKAALPGWKATAGAKRGAIMLKFADLLEKNVDRIAKLESQCKVSCPVCFPLSIDSFQVWVSQ